MKEMSRCADFKDIWDLLNIFETSVKSKQVNNLDILAEQLYDFIGCNYKIGRKYPSTKLTRILINKLVYLYIAMAINRLETADNEDSQLDKIEELFYGLGTSLINEYANKKGVHNNLK